MAVPFPKISIITVCYNAAHLLKKTIESVLEQTYPAIEYIIIDGASTDNTIEIVKSYCNNVHQFISEPDSGLYDAMNKGIKMATGDLVIFLNAGDYFVSKDVIDFYLSKINTREADLFFGRIVWNDTMRKDIFLSEHDSSVYPWDLKNSNFPHPATIYKKELFYKIGFFDLGYSILADYDWNIRCLLNEKIKFQYINIIVTVFFVDGISNDPFFSKKVLDETEQIHQQYFKPGWLYSFIEKKVAKKQGKRVTEKILSKLYNKKLNRIY